MNLFPLIFLSDEVVVRNGVIDVPSLPMPFKPSVSFRYASGRFVPFYMTSF